MGSIPIPMELTVGVMTTINVSYVRLLSEIYEQLQLDVPQIVVNVDAEGKFVGYMDLQIPQSEIVVETVRCSSSQFPTSAGAEQDTARLALKRLKDECDLQIKDINYDDSLLYKNLYKHQTIDYAVVSAQLSNLSREYNFLKECYISTVAQEYVNERIQLRRAVEECYAIVNRIIVVTPAPETDPSEAMSNQLP
uniref:Uncharacterized protein n=1 Tax=Ananas comosus var. bracteatus TaxID=296719 RepID=A0A6V7NWZ5_ANACO|nr:unnamed protein product [Ananas comosus var. bracteatus]